MVGYIYALYNPSLREYGENHLIKVGMTRNDVQERIDQLYSTGLPEPFKCIYFRKVEHYKKVEKYIHTALRPQRFNESREFFLLPIYQTSSLLDSLIEEYNNMNDTWSPSYGANRYLYLSKDF
jgi:two-component SAPR family response regulator